jgi:hypothetical protein
MATKKHNMHAVLAGGGHALAQADAATKIWILTYTLKEKQRVKSFLLATAAMEQVTAEREYWIREVGLKACAEAFATYLKNAGCLASWPEPIANTAEAP